MRRPRGPNTSLSYGVCIRSMNVADGVRLLVLLVAARRRDSRESESMMQAGLGTKRMAGYCEPKHLITSTR